MPHIFVLMTRNEHNFEDERLDSFQNILVNAFRGICIPQSKFYEKEIMTKVEM